MKNWTIKKEKNQIVFFEASDESDPAQIICTAKPIADHKTETDHDALN